MSWRKSNSTWSWNPAPSKRPRRTTSIGPPPLDDSAPLDEVAAPTLEPQPPEPAASDDTLLLDEVLDEVAASDTAGDGIESGTDGRDVLDFEFAENQPASQSPPDGAPAIETPTVETPPSEASTVASVGPGSASLGSGDTAILDEPVGEETVADALVLDSAPEDGDDDIELPTVENPYPAGLTAQVVSDRPLWISSTGPDTHEAGDELKDEADAPTQEELEAAKASIVPPAAFFDERPAEIGPFAGDGGRRRRDADPRRKQDRHRHGVGFVGLHRQNARRDRRRRRLGRRRMGKTPPRCPNQ